MSFSWIEAKPFQYAAEPAPGWLATVEQDIDTGDWVCELHGPGGEKAAEFTETADQGQQWCEKEFMNTIDRHAQISPEAPVEMVDTATSPELGELQAYFEAIYDQSGPQGLLALAFSGVDETKLGELNGQLEEDPQTFINQMVATLKDTPNAVDSWKAYIAEEPQVSEEVVAEEDKSVAEISNDDVVKQVATDSPGAAEWLGTKSANQRLAESAVRRATRTAVDQDTKDYWTSYFGQYGFEFTRDLALLGQKKVATNMDDRLARLHERQGRTAQPVQAAKLETIWVVTKPSDVSEMADICWSIDLQGLASQFKGGLNPEDIVAMFDNEAEAKALATQLLASRGASHVAVDAPTLKYLTDYYAGYGDKWTRDIALGGQKIAQVSEQPDQWVQIADGVAECDFSDGSHGCVVSQDDPKFPFQLTVVRFDGGVVEFPCSSMEEAMDLAEVGRFGLGTPGLVDEVVAKAQNIVAKNATAILRRAQSTDFSVKLQDILSRAGIHAENASAGSGIVCVTLMLEPEAQKTVALLQQAGYKDVETEHAADRWFVSAEIPEGI